MPRTISLFPISKGHRKDWCAILTIYVAKSTGFALLGVMKTTSPVDRNIAFLSIQASRALHAASSADTAKLKKPIKNRAIVSNVVFALFPHITVHVVRCNLLKEIDVIISVKLCHLASRRRFCALRVKVSQRYRGVAIKNIAQIHGFLEHSHKSPSSGKGCTA